MKVIGVQEKNGEYQGYKYHNVLLHCTKDLDTCLGTCTEVVKINFSAHEEIFGKVYTPSDWQALIGKDIIPMYDRFGKVNFIQFVGCNVNNEPLKKTS